MSLSVLVIGGGASGTLLAIRLLRGNADTHVALIERSPSLGRGLAYATEDDRHLLNVVPGRLSAFADDPDHFRRWLIQNRRLRPEDKFAFVPRRYLGAYLEATLQAVAARTGRLRIFHDTVESLHPGDQSTTAILAGGRVVSADIVVLATGHDTPYLAVAPSPGDKDLPILILGTGLSMADACLSMTGSGRRIIAMSRRGLLPLTHGTPLPLPVEPPDLPFGASVTQLLRWVRNFARKAEQETGDWRPAVDTLRPHTQRLWESWSIGSRHRFLRHLKPWWDIHRHRLPATVHGQLHTRIAAGNLEIIAAAPLLDEIEAGAQTIRFRRRGSPYIETLAVSAVIDCRGLVRDWRDRAGSLISHLIADGHARVDPFGLGIEVTGDNEVVSAGGHAQPNIFAIGPLTRGRWFEIEAVPDIRAQCDRLAGHLETAFTGSGASHAIAI